MFGWFFTESGGGGKELIRSEKKRKMGDQDDGLKLSLSLGFGEENHHKSTSPSPSFPLNLMPSSLPNFMQQQQHHQLQLQKASFLADVFQSASGESSTSKI